MMVAKATVCGLCCSDGAVDVLFGAADVQALAGGRLDVRQGVSWMDLGSGVCMVDHPDVGVVAVLWERAPIVIALRIRQITEPH
jgi:hypothetical protein